jgi:TolB-like protein/DNA-binding winged helix-turn-helix (wHTH) protein/Flp pilus assembly protein TadD
LLDQLETNDLYVFGPYCLDRQARVLLRDGAIVPLTPKVLDTLMALVKNRGEVVSKDKLLSLVWPDSFVEESNLAQNISVLRKTLGQQPDHVSYIETISKRGYRFVAEVNVIPRAAEPVEKSSPQVAVTPEITGSPALARPQRYTSILAVAMAILLCGAAGFWYYRQLHSRIPEIHSIAVLPLKNLSGDTQQEYLADGITELLTTELSKALRIRVTSRTSAMHYRNTDKPLPVIARELNVDAVVEGSVVRSGNRLRVTVQLVHGPSDRHIWAETYDRDLIDVLALQQQVAAAVAHEIRVNTAPAGQSRTVVVNPNAFEAYLRARYYLNQRTGPEIDKAISWYQKAIEEDPAYAPAYAGLADCYNQLGTVMIGARPPLESRKVAVAAANRALEIDPELAEAHAALAYSNLYDWNWSRAERGFERAVALNPNYAPAHLWYAHYFAARGQFDRALQEVRLAGDLDPLSPITQTQIGWILVYARRFPEGIAQYHQVLQANPTYLWAQWQLGIALMFTRDYSAAIETFRQAAALDNRSSAVLGTLGMAYGLAGLRREAEKIADELIARSRRGYVPAHSIMEIYVGLEDREKVFEWMEKSYQERTNGMAWLAVWPGFDSIREDPRFDMYLHRIGLK